LLDILDSLVYLFSLFISSILFCNS